MDRKAQYGGVDWFRLICAVLVIAIHTSPLLCFGELPDFILTRILARVAVPFFLMVTGFFILPDIQWDNGKHQKWLRQIGKIGKLYLAAMLLYLPLMIYSGYFGQDLLFGD